MIGRVIGVVVVSRHADEISEAVGLALKALIELFKALAVSAPILFWKRASYLTRD